MAHVRIPTPLRKYTAGAEAVEAEGATVAALVDDLERRYPGIRERICDEKGITKLPDRLDDFIQLAVDLTDRSQNRYGISTRGSKSWATIHPGFMTQYTREGAVDYTFNGSDLIAEMDSDKAIAFTEKWIEMQHKAGPTSWTSPRACSGAM